VEGITELEAAVVLLVAHLIFHGDSSGDLSNHHCFSAFWLLDLSMRQVRGIVNNVEVVSFAMITLLRLGYLRRTRCASKVCSLHPKDSLKSLVTSLPDAFTRTDQALDIRT
tara:strand:+ start:641 stop:973 length:333 start_codon:yes stop_codon:yes gene_type:complete